MKPYVKPELFYESFEMNQSIAACRWDVVSADANNCKAWYDPELTNKGTGNPENTWYIFANERVCEGNVVDPEAYCYMPGAGSVEKSFQS